MAYQRKRQFPEGDMTSFEWHWQRTTYTYFIRAGDDGPVKIGISSDPWRRLKDMQTGNADPLRLLAIFPGAHHEKAFHDRFGALRLQGEWFDCTTELLETIIGTAAERADIRSQISRSLGEAA